MLDHEIWTSPDGVAAALINIPCDNDEWFPEEPGQRPPRSYQLVAIASGSVVYETTVFPLEPWNAYDAVTDELIWRGWLPPPPDPDDCGTCAHGLSMHLCAGPNHYPED